MAGNRNGGIEFMGYTFGTLALVIMAIPLLIALCCCGGWIISVATADPRPAPTITTPTYPTEGD